MFVRRWRWIKEAWSHWSLLKDRSRSRLEIDFILNEAKESQTFGGRVEWLIKLFTWVRVLGRLESEGNVPPHRVPGVRLKFILQKLQKDESLQKEFSRIFLQTLNEMSGSDFFADVGIRHDSAFIQELINRMSDKVLPGAPLFDDLSTLVVTLFPDDSDVFWIHAIEPEVLREFINIFQKHTEPSEWVKVTLDLEDALVDLVAQVRSTGFTSEIRALMKSEPLRQTPFYSLAFLGAQFLESSRNPGDETPLIEALQRCRGAINDAYTHLNEHGVSVSLVFRLERLRRQIERAQFVCHLLLNRPDRVTLIRNFMVVLVEGIQSKRSVRSLIRSNMQLLTRKIVDRNAETGEHYITRTRNEYFEMFNKGCIGGAITVVTILVKFALSSIGLAPFPGGLVASINYALSFSWIQLAGGSLATKQPASTAPVIAQKIKENDESPKVLVEDMVNILRTQGAAITGNVLTVIPLAILVDAAVYLSTHRHFLSPVKAEHTVLSTDILGPTVIFGAFTGVLLFASSLFAGWMDNWFVFRRLKYRIAFNEKVRFVFGEDIALRMAQFFERNIAGLAGNISLGFLLGLLPEILKFLGIPLEVRHITLSSGSLAIAVQSLGVDVIYTPEFIRAALGIVLIAALNLGVSFLCAFLLATTATGLSVRRSFVVLMSVLRSILFQPWILVLPRKKQTELPHSKSGPQT